MFPLPCVLFAGGKSSRMGQDKSLLPFGGSPTLTEFQYRRLALLFSHVAISTKDAQKFSFEADFILDPKDAEFAPTAGFISSFYHLRSDRIMVLSVDTPFVDESVFNTLLEHDDFTYDAIIAKTSEGSHPMCGIYHRSLLQEFERMLSQGDHRLGKLLSHSKTLFVNFDDEGVFMNLNHPQEYHEACKKIAHT